MPSILIVDDHPAICFALKASLEVEEDLTVTTTTDGGKVMFLIRELKPDLIILDISLLKLDGLDLLARIKHYRPTIRVLILTGLPAEVYAPRSLKAGADGFLSKQHLLTAISAVVRLLLDGYSCFPSGSFIAENAPCASAEAESSRLLARMSDRELTVLRYLAEGKSNKEIGELLQLSNKTISTYKARLLEKSGTESLAELLQQFKNIK
ncbi:response regulator [Mixta tenebrionis]|uniref:Response regulator transcription factor n=1 Tax=Mixta tenebrionis TaxID=2562439 RepID=A0A506V4Y8_9GAMM|nr:MULTISPECIES: response regulator transcription factor [Mixta]QHM77979.1 Virulence factors putative positive transcription regulator BvgA [Mixta theicola]TPW40961.1 response regulator transcription factor [Mixta tenebrionis]